MEIVWQTGVVLGFYALNILFGVLGPVLVAKMVGRSKYAKLRMCFGMK